jgi:adenine/guanine phosphoribosyltransferase-like PRPP-binding protein
MLAVASPPRPRASTRPLRLVDLLNDLDELVHLLHLEFTQGSVLNAYLLAAGIGQVTEDYLYSDRGLLLKAATHLRASAGVAGKAAAAIVVGVDTSWRALRRLWGGDELAERWLVGVRSLVTALAPYVVTGEDAGWRTSSAPLARRLFEANLELPARLRRSVVRLPSCFRSFDQHPEDMNHLAARFAVKFPERNRPTTVVGLRTSGSYLAPLVASALEGLGFENVGWLTMRPGSPPGAAQRRTIRQAARAGGRVLIIDDPPTTGGSYRRAALALAELGVREEAIVLLVCLGPARVEPPDALRSYPGVVLAWADWSINDRLQTAAVGDALAGLLAPRRRIDSIARVSFDATPRGHASARFSVRVTDVQDGTHTLLQVHAAGVGVGYFGEHSLAVARRLARFSPRLHGMVDGVLFREWLPDGRRLEPAIAMGDPRVTAAVVDYVVSRRDALRTSADTAQRLRGRMPAWEAVSNLLSRAFGRGWAWSRLPLVDPTVKDCLRAEVASVVDGCMAPHNWFAGYGWPRSIRKVDADRRAFANLDLASYDAVYDLASFAADAELIGAGSGDASRRAYEQATGETVSAERWFLLQVLHLWDRQRLGLGEDSALRRAMSRAAQRYFAEVFLNGTRTPAHGPLVALDIDGVLEGEALGFSCLTGASAIALRALLRHGFRPVLITGRSLAEVRDRCAALSR